MSCKHALLSCSVPCMLKSQRHDVVSCRPSRHATEGARLQEGDNSKASNQGCQIGKALELLSALLHKTPVGLCIALPQQEGVVEHALFYVLCPPGLDLVPALTAQCIRVLAAAVTPGLGNCYSVVHVVLCSKTRMKDHLLQAFSPSGIHFVQGAGRTAREPVCMCEPQCSTCCVLTLL